MSDAPARQPDDEGVSAVIPASRVVQRRVLIVDDDRELTEALWLALTGERYQVRVANTTQDALATLAEFLPELVLLDYRMPGSDGASFYVELCRRYGKIPTILISGSSVGRELARRLGVDYLPKPFLLHQLVDRIEKRLPSPTVP